MGPGKGPYAFQGVGTPGMSLSLPRLDPEQLAKLSDADRDRVALELKSVEAALKANPLLGYEPHVRQVAFHRPPFPPLRAFFGGNRSGKTTAAMVDTIIQCVDRECLPTRLVPFKRWEP